MNIAFKNLNYLLRSIVTLEGGVIHKLQTHLPMSISSFLNHLAVLSTQNKHNVD